ncbi:MAG: hypothetical protein QOD07_2356 [Frankiaceae bacterium]|jgi:hypothetical protein|nr:hypothetical protein [Frankiaceae bacterium]
MGNHAATLPRRRVSGRKKAVAALGITAAAASLLGSGIYASWSTSSAIASGSYNAATAGSSFSETGTNAFDTAVSNMVPGDYTVHYTDLNNDGSVAQQFTGAVDGVGALAGSGGLTVAIDSCSSSWNQADGSCGNSGSVTAVLPATEVSATPAVTFGQISGGSSMHLKVTITLPSDAPSRLAGATGTVTVHETAGISATGSDRSAG